MKNIRYPIIGALSLWVSCMTSSLNVGDIDGVWNRIEPQSTEGWVVTIDSGSFVSPNGECSISNFKNDEFRFQCNAKDLKPICEDCALLDVDMNCSIWKKEQTLLGIQCPKGTGEKILYSRMDN